jgi:hypothetical protein
MVFIIIILFSERASPSLLFFLCWLKRVYGQHYYEHISLLTPMTEEIFLILNVACFIQLFCLCQHYSAVLFNIRSLNVDHLRVFSEDK